MREIPSGECRSRSKPVKVAGWVDSCMAVSIPVLQILGEQCFEDECAGLWQGDNSRQFKGADAEPLEGGTHRRAADEQGCWRTARYGRSGFMAGEPRASNGGGKQGDSRQFKGAGARLLKGNIRRQVTGKREGDRRGMPSAIVPIFMVYLSVWLKTFYAPVP